MEIEDEFYPINLLIKHQKRYSNLVEGQVIQLGMFFTINICS
jgi:hypothetical protein